MRLLSALAVLKSNRGGSAILHSESVLSDSLGRLTQSTNELGTYTATYLLGNLSSNMNTWSRPNGLNTQCDWYAAGDGANALALKEIHHTQGGATVSKFGYEYSLTGSISKWSRQLGPGVTNQKDWSLGYSRAGELTGLIEKNSSGVETNRASWSYDPAGNWYAQGDSTGSTQRTHNSMNRLNKIGGAGRTVVEGTLDESGVVSVDGAPATVTSIPGTTKFNFQKEIAVQEGANTFQITATDANGNKRVQNYSVQVGGTQKTYEYDFNGNLLREKDPSGTIIRSFEWNAADQLKAINWGTQRIEWTYNGLGQKVTESINGTLTKRFQWDGAELLLEKSATSTITKRFYGDGEQRVGGTDAGNYFYTRDHLGSVREVVNQTGVLQARYDYDAYGKRSILYQNSSYLNGCTFGYTGHLTLTALAAGQSELLLAHYRTYDPQLGRWLSADPMGEIAGLNLYSYVKAKALNAWDPDGRWLHIVGGLIIGALYGGIVAGMHDGNMWKGIVAGAVGGAVFAATFNPAAGAGAMALIGAGIGAGATSGLASGVVGELFDAANPCDHFSIGDVAEQVVYGAVVGGATAPLGGLISLYADTEIANMGTAFAFDKIGNLLFTEGTQLADDNNMLNFNY